MLEMLILHGIVRRKVVAMRVAVVQFDPTLGDIERNLRSIDGALEQAAEQGASLVVFPECAVSGYVYRSLDEALQVAESIPGQVTDFLATSAARHNLYTVVGMLERAGDRCYNSAMLVGPSGLQAVYRKTHTLCLGVDRFTTPGDIPFAVLEIPGARLGILICYDLRFPEPARILALQGAQIIVLPTNWPVTSTIQADLFTRTRAAENRVFVLAADRVGAERGATFLGRSQIVGPDGTVRAEADQTREETLVIDIDPTEADSKRMVVRPGEHEFDFFGDRRPDLYDSLSLEPARVQ
jgi:5-aminopentanamidase